jgi:hypothetical protein
MFSKAPKGASMMDSFRPFMTTQRLDGFQTDMAYVRNAVTEGQLATAQLSAGSGDPAPGAAALQRRFGGFAREWTAVDADMGGMLRTIKANLPNYQAIAALPSFRLFPWFFVIPGVLMVVLGGTGLVRPSAWRALRWAAVGVGLALAIAPVGFQMFSRAPKGAAMMSTFKTIETHQHLRRIQGYFSEMAVGQGIVQLQLAPALRRGGGSGSVSSSRYPALDKLDREWVHILNDMTPMIAAMSDNIGNYQAISSLPSFRLFPWFFLLPGLIAVALALLGRRRRGLVRMPIAEPSRPLTSRSDLT